MSEDVAVEPVLAMPEEKEPEPVVEVPEEEAASPIPEWVVLPPDLKLPEGRIIAFMRFRAGWTDTPNKGERQCILWNLSDGDEKLALKRISASGDMLGVATELSKQCVRAVDGSKVNWMRPSGPGSLDEFWREIGAKCRQAIVRWYTQNHTLTEAEQVDFFANCVATLTAG